LNPSFDSARAAAHAVAALQDYPTGSLYLVATPIGNLADISLRTLHILGLVDAVACEDTRHSQQLFRSLGLDTAKPQWIAVHQHNEASSAPDVIAAMQKGLRVAYLSDAGAPGISDPGTRLVRLTLQAGLRAIPLPGASSVTTVLSASGAWLSDRADFVFQGFLPAKGQARALRLNELMQDPRPQCLLEAPHRIEELAAALRLQPVRGLTVGRELSKQFEEIALIDTHQFATWLRASPHRLKGEFALVLHEIPATEQTAATTGERELRALLPHLPLKTAVQVATELSGGSRKGLYALALTLQETLNPET
jgi:16S rRNA (cytidine1402-2'-O)-methyltransferase